MVKKKPLVKQLHSDTPSKEEEGEQREGNGAGCEGVGEGWVTAVAAFTNSDLVASGLLLYIYISAILYVWVCSILYKALVMDVWHCGSVVVTSDPSTAVSQSL